MERGDAPVRKAIVIGRGRQVEGGAPNSKIFGSRD